MPLHPDDIKLDQAMVRSPRTGHWYAVRAEPGQPYSSEVRDGAPDPRVSLALADPLVGRVARWGGMYTGEVVAVVRYNGKPFDLLLHDWCGYPWVRVPLDAEMVGDDNASAT